MKNKTVLYKTCDLPNNKILGLGLSLRDIAKKCHNISKKYNTNIINENIPKFDQINRQQDIRRILSNWVNDPTNLVDYKGMYIGDKYGARITVCRTDGLVLHDVETFCRDVRNKNNRIIGNNNNFVFIKDDSVELDKQNQNYIYSTLNLDKVENSNITYDNLNAYKVKSSSIPSSNPSSSLMQYSPNETADVENVTIVSGEVMDDHTTRKEFIQAACGKYGYASRLSKTVNSISYYVCKHIEGDNGKSVFLRLSYYQYDPPKILEIAASTGNFTSLITAVKAAGLIKALSGLSEFTVFAPTDAAFAKLPAGTVAGLLQDLPTLTNILKYHVVGSKVMAADLAKLTSSPTLEGKNVTISVQNGKVFINNAQVVTTDIVAPNGVIHVIDTVLLPPPS